MTTLVLPQCVLYSAHCAHPAFCPLCSLPIFCPLCKCASCILPPCILSSSSIRPFFYSATLGRAYCFPVTAFILCSLFLPCIHHSAPFCMLCIAHCAVYYLTVHLIHCYPAIETSCDGMRVVKVSCPSLQNICRLIASYRSHPCLYTSDMALCLLSRLWTVHIFNFFTTRNS